MVMGSLFFSGRQHLHLPRLYAEFWRLIPRANIVFQRDDRKNRYATSAITASVTKKEGSKLEENLLYALLRFGRHYNVGQYVLPSEGSFSKLKSPSFQAITASFLTGNIYQQVQRGLRWL